MIAVALSTGSIYTYGTARAFELAARAGYDGLEVIVDDRWDTRQPAYLRRLSEEHRLPVLSVHSPFVQTSGWPGEEIERVKHALAVAKGAGARVLNVHLPLRVRDLVLMWSGKRWILPVPGASAGHRAFARWLVDGGLAELEGKTAVTIVIENLPVRRLLGRRYSAFAMNTWEALASFPRLCLDTTHCGTTGSDLLAVYERLADRVVHVHLSDYDGKHQHQPVGKGYLPLAGFLQALVGRGYDGEVVVELTPHALPVQDEAALAAELRRNLEFCRRHLGQVLGSPQESLAAPLVGAISSP